jgi:hypothetical protein
LETEEYDDSSYDPVDTLHHTDRENRAMASVFSYYEVCFHSPHHISDSSLTVELNRLFIATIVQPRIRNALHPFMEPRRMTPTGPREHQGGFYDIL